jgi:hypothetical protein
VSKSAERAQGARKPAQIALQFATHILVGLSQSRRVI